MGLEIQTDWQLKKLGALCDFFADGNWIESKDQSFDGIRLIQTGNIGEGIFKDRFEKARYISEKTFERLKCTEVFAGDVLISRLPDPVGRACILPKIKKRMITAVDCSILRFNEQKIIPEYFNYYAQSNKYLNDVEKKTTGTTRKRISRKNLGLIEIPVPSLPEQKRIVSFLNNLSAQTKILADINKRKMNNLDELKQSILHQAFTGKL